jgi:ABC-type multidrug transport system ATPase subunit
VELLAMLRQLAEREKAILISSHILDDLPELCSTGAILECGKLMEHGELDAIRPRGTPGWGIIVRVLDRQYELIAALEKMDHVSSARIVNGEIHFITDGNDETVSNMHARLYERRYQVVEFRRVQADLYRVLERWFDRDPNPVFFREMRIAQISNVFLGTIIGMLVLIFFLNAVFRLTLPFL